MKGRVGKEYCVNVQNTVSNLKTISLKVFRRNATNILIIITFDNIIQRYGKKKDYNKVEPATAVATVSLLRGIFPSIIEQLESKAATKTAINSIK